VQRSNQFDQFSELGQHETKCRYSLTHGGGRISQAWRDLINSISFSELGQHEKWRRGICGIRKRDLTCDHLPKAVVQGIRGARRQYRYLLTQGGGAMSKVCRDLISSIRFETRFDM